MLTVVDACSASCSLDKPLPYGILIPVLAFRVTKLLQVWYLSLLHMNLQNPLSPWFWLKLLASIYSSCLVWKKRGHGFSWQIFLHQPGRVRKMEFHLVERVSKPIRHISWSIAIVTVCIKVWQGDETGRTDIRSWSRGIQGRWDKPKPFQLLCAQDMC